MTPVAQIHGPEEVEHFKNVFQLLSPIQQKIFKYLHWFCRNYRTVKPSHNHIAKEVGCCRDTVMQAIKQFEKNGWIVKIKKAWKTCTYMVKEQLLLLNLNDRNTFRRIPPKNETFSNNAEEANCLREKMESAKETKKQIPTVNSTEKPTIDPTPIKKYYSHTLNVNVNEDVPKKEPVVAIPHELDQLPISARDKNILSRYSLQILRLAIEDYKSYKEIKSVKNIAAFVTSRCKEYRIKLLEWKQDVPEDRKQKKTEEVVNAFENKRLSCALEMALNARKDRKLRVEALSNHVELLDAIPGQTLPICIGYEDGAFRGKLERALRRWLPNFNLKEFGKEFLNREKENKEKSLSENPKKKGNRTKIPTKLPTVNPTEKPTHIKKYYSHTLNVNVNDGVDVQNEKKEQGSSIPHELDKLPISSKDKRVLSGYNLQTLRLAIEDYNSYKEIKQVKNIAAFVTSRCQNYRIKLLGGKRNVSESHSQEKAESGEVNTLENKNLSCALERALSTMKDRKVKVEALNNHIELIDTIPCQNPPTCIDYGDEAFRGKLERALRRWLPGFNLKAFSKKFLNNEKENLEYALSEDPKNLEDRAKIPTLNPTIDPTPINKYYSHTLNVNVNDGVQKTKKEPASAIPHELDQLPISSKDKRVLSRYNLQTLRLAIEDYNSYKEIKRVKNIAAFVTSRCQNYRIKLLGGERSVSESHSQEKAESGEVYALENKSLSCALERALSAMKDRKVKGEALNSHIELIDTIPCQNSPTRIDYGDMAFRGKLERALKRWFPGFSLKAFSKKFLNNEKENQQKNLSEDSKNMEDRAKIPTLNPTIGPTIEPTHITKSYSHTLNVNEGVGVQNEKKEPASSIPHELDKLPISSKDKNILSRYSLQTLRLAIEDYNSYKESKQVKNIAAFLTSRCKDYRIKLLEGGKSANEGRSQEKIEADEFSARENKSPLCDARKWLRGKLGRVLGINVNQEKLIFCKNFFRNEKSCLLL